MYIEGNLVDVETGEIYPARVTFTKTITKIQKIDKKCDTFLVPGFIDSHIRVEDSFLTPLEYTKLALLSGVTTVVEDPSGFIRTSGAEGLKYLITEFSKLPIDFFYLYPINIERNEFESGPEEVKIEEFTELIKHKQCLGLTQVSDVIKLRQEDPIFLKRMSVAKNLNKPIISNIEKIHFTDLGKFAQFGIRADIGSNVYQDAFEKACFGIKIKIVEGTTRKTLAGLLRLAKQFDTSIVSEEKSASDLAKGYMKATLKKAISLGLDPVTTIRNVTRNPAQLLGIEEGVIAEGKKANIVELTNLKDFEIKRVFHNGECVVKQDKIQTLKKEKIREPRYTPELIKLIPEDIELPSEKKKEIANVLTIDNTIEEIILPVEDEKIGLIEGVHKLVVADKYGSNQIAIGFVKGFGIQKGALATSLYGSSGNIIAIGSSDEEIVQAINTVCEAKGGCALIDKKRKAVFPLSILGTVSGENANKISEEYKKIIVLAKRLGCSFDDPFLALGSMMNISKQYALTDSGLVNNSETYIEVLKEDN